MNLKPLRMVQKQHTHPAQRVHVKVHQIRIVSRNRVVAHHREADVPVDEREQLRHVLFEALEGVPDVHLRDVGAVRRRVVEEEAFAGFVRPVAWWVGVGVDDAGAVAVAVWVGDAGTVAVGVFEGVGLRLGLRLG